MRSFVLLTLALLAQPAFAAEWVLVEGQNVTPRPQAKVFYLDLSSVRAVGAETEFEVAMLRRGHQMDERPWTYVQRYRIDCVWRTSTTGPTRSLGPIIPAPPSSTPAPPPEERWIAPVFAEDTAIRVAEKAICDSDAPAGDRHASDEAMLNDGLGRLGYSDIASAFAMPQRGYVVPAPFRVATPASSKDLEPQSLVHDQSAAGKVVFVTPSTVQRSGAQIRGRSVWIVGTGRPPAERSYAYRYFEADCTQGTIAFETLNVWPTERRGAPQPGERVAVPSAKHAPEASTPAASVLQSACTGAAPLKKVASFSELIAYVDNPAEDPVFHARRQETIPVYDMRWLAKPSPEQLAAVLPAGALAPGEWGETKLKCFVSRAYTLSECSWSSRNPPDRKLEDAHLLLADKYIPAKQTYDGKDTAGHFVEAAVAWSPEGPIAAPRIIASDSMRWRQTPSRSDIRKVYKLGKPAETLIECSITAGYALADCRTAGVLIGSSTRFVRSADGKMEIDKENDPNTVFGQTMLGLVSKFVPEQTTTQGDGTARRKVLMRLAFP